METINSEGTKKRKAEHSILPVILGRWSPRALSGEDVPDSELMPLFEAARWAPSSYNNQPWRFIYAKKGTPEWNRFFNLLAEGNKGWAGKASVLVVIASLKNFEFNGKPSSTHKFDTGAAWQNLALEAGSRNIVAHGMEGFDHEKARKELEIPEDYTVEAMVAIGRRGDKEGLPDWAKQAEIPSPRKPITEFVMQGKFKKK